MLDHIATKVLEVDLSTDAGSTITGPVVLMGIQVATALSAHSVLIKDNATTKMTIPASTAVGSINCYGLQFATSLVITPNASSTGTLWIYYKEV